jgi:hypothetical protein
MTDQAKKTSSITTPIACPKCGESDLSELRAVENSTVTYSFGVETGVLVVDSSSYNDDGGDSETLRLECMGCLTQFPVPSGLKVDYRDGLDEHE